MSWEDACPSLADEPVHLTATAVDGGLVELTWGEGYLVGDFSGRLYRKDPGGSWEPIADLTLPHGEPARYVDRHAPQGAAYRIRLVLDCGSHGIVEGDPTANGTVDDDAVLVTPAPEGWVSPATTLAEHCEAIRPQDVRVALTPEGAVVTWRDGALPDTETSWFELYRRHAGADEWELFNGRHVTPEERAAVAAAGDTSGVWTFLDEEPGDAHDEYGVALDEGHACWPPEVVPAVPVD